jgi:hydroxymethylpyrimidine pyrophosphatase-like HAD family hydrolase
MKRKAIVVTTSVIIIFLLIIVVGLYSNVNMLLNADNRIIDIGNYNVLQTPEEMYYQVCDEDNMFDDEIIIRTNHFSSLDESKSIQFCEVSKEETLLSKLFGGLDNAGEEIQVYENNGKAEIFSRKECSQYFVKKDFSLPKISPDEIESIVVSDSRDYNNILKIYTDPSDIKNILENYNDFFKDIHNEYSESYDCYIVYKNYDLIEFISADYLESLQPYIAF